jgi:hypothetical protein
MALVYEVLKRQTPTSAGLEVISHGLGVTPQVALLFGGVSQADDGTVYPDASLSMGFASDDGAQQASNSVWSEDLQSYTSTGRRQARGDSCILITFLPSLGNNEARMAGWDQSSISLNWEIDDAVNQRYYGMVLIAGMAGTAGFLPNIVDNLTENIGINADGFLAFTAGTSYNDSPTTHMGGFSIGSAYNNGGVPINVMQWGFEADTVVDGAPQSAFLLDGSLLATGSTGIHRAFGIDGYGTGTVTFNHVRGSTSLLRGSVIGFEMPTDKSLHAGHGLTPTSTGQVSFTTGHKPGLVVFFGGSRDSLNVADQYGGTDRQGSFYIGATDGVNSFCLSTHIEYGVGDTNTGTAFKDGVVIGSLHDDGSGYRLQASLDSMDTDGFTLDFTNVDATYPMYFGWMSFEAEDTGGGSVEVYPDRIENVNEVYQPTIEFGSVDVNVSRIENVNDIYQPTLEFGSVDVNVSRIENVNDIYQPTLEFGSVDVNVIRIENVNEVYQPTIEFGSVDVNVSRIENVNDIYQPTLELGPIDVNVSRIENVNEVYQPTLEFGVFVEASRIENTNVVYQPTLEFGPISISVSRIDNTNEVYQPDVEIGLMVETTRIDNVNEFYQPTVEFGPIDVLVGRIDNTNEIYQPTIGIESGNDILVTRIDNANVVYQPTIEMGEINIQVTRIDNVNVVYQPTVDDGRQEPVTVSVYIYNYTLPPDLTKHVLRPDLTSYTLKSEV